MTKTVSNRCDDLEFAVGNLQSDMNSLKETMEVVLKKLDQICKTQEELKKTPLEASRSGIFNSTPGSYGSNNSGDGSRFLAIKGRRLELPTFNGEDPDGWILRAERYFSLNRLTLDEQLEVAIISLEGDALRWFQWENKRCPMKRWQELKALILYQFRSTASGSLCEQFLAVKQSGTVAEYIKNYVALASPLTGISEEVYLSQFINGLDPVIRAEMRLHSPLTLNDAMELANRVEERSKILNRFRLTVPSNYKRNSEQSNSMKPSVTELVEDPIKEPLGELRRLSDKELQLKRSLGLCFRCDDKFSPGHVCKKKELNVIVTQMEEEEERSNAGKEDPEITAEVVEIGPKVEVHLNSVVGITNPKTMKLEGKMQEQRVVILIDSGATHNFISHELVEQLKLKMDTTVDYNIALGNSLKVPGSGICRGVHVRVQGIDITDDFLPIDLGNSDIILGIQWLETLGETRINWKTQLMKFQMGGRTVTLRGDMSLGRSLVSLKSLSKTCLQEGYGFLVEYGEMKVTDIHEMISIPKVAHDLYCYPCYSNPAYYGIGIIRLLVIVLLPLLFQFSLLWNWNSGWYLMSFWLCVLLSSKESKKFLVKWKDLLVLEASWENLAAMIQQFHDAHLEDKVLHLQGGIDKPPVRSTHARRGKG